MSKEISARVATGPTAPTTAQTKRSTRRSPLRRASVKAATALAAGSLLLVSAGIVHADIVEHDIVDAVAKAMPLNAGGPGVTTTLVVAPETGDGKNGCNLTGDTTLKLNLVSSNLSVATVSPSSVTFTSCGDKKTLTVTPVAVGDATVTAIVPSGGNTTGGTFDLTRVPFAVKVVPAAPSNTAPTLEITGTDTGASYNKGSVPATVCNVTDAEDGSKSPAPTLSAVTGDYAADGIGSQTTTCSYTDAGGLTVTSSVTYTIIDPTPPMLTYRVNPAAADGLDGWYKSPVTLTWNVSEADSPSSVTRTGCEDVTVSSDQVAQNYTCSATSAGGSTDPVTVSLKKDALAPGVSFTSVAAGTAGTNGWYTSDVTATFTATDATSGPASATGTADSTGEGSAVTVNSPAFSDLAGNTAAAGTASETFKIDQTKPTVSHTSPPAGTLGTNGWYTSDVTATFTATDATSGLASATKTVTSAVEGAAVTVDSPAFSDLAGNTTAAGAVSSEAFKIDKTAPGATFSDPPAPIYFGSTPAKPTCTAVDSLSGPGTCVVSDYDTTTTTGAKKLKATVTDMAGNTATVYADYTVLPWTVQGFYQPVDMGGVFNTVKSGSTVPVKFEVFAGSAGNNEITDISKVPLTAAKIPCPSAASFDEIEQVLTSNTSLRYDTTAGQFIYNWKTPTVAGNCYKLTMTATDGSTLSANFKMR